MSSARSDFKSTDPTLRPPKFQRRRLDLFHAVVELVEDQERYEILSKDEAACRLTANVASGFGSTHAVEIWVEGNPEGPSSAHMTSRKRAGLLPDFGAAARNIREFNRLLHHRQS